MLLHMRVVAILIFVVVLSIFSMLATNFAQPLQFSRSAETSARWIVVTSIQYPTEDVKRLAEMEGWKLVVVGDGKTPPDWNLTGVHYLSLKAQKDFGARIASLLPTGSYTRKNIGYLYAILHGAEWIYDTDDDNKPYGEGLQGFDFESITSGLRYTRPQTENMTIGDKLFNPYSFYGQEKMWPRGFPLDSIMDHQNNNTMMLCSRMRSAAVQQGLVHNDPDVDAIYRLLNADRKSGLSEGFNPYAPPIVLDKEVYAPWNSQNTLFHRRAFFTMFLPTTVAFRVTDIWRSYFSQRLLHLIGENVAFYPVNAVQKRNAHNYLKDFMDETAVYEQTGDMVEFLDEWDCKKGKIEECTIELANAFAELGFWQQADAGLVRVWIEDLKAIGYNFPPIVRTSSLSYEENMNSTNMHFRLLNCRRAKIGFTEPRAATDMESLTIRAEQKIRNAEELSAWCSAGNYTTLGDGIEDRSQILNNHLKNAAIHQKLNMALIVTNNWPWKFGIGLLQRMYEPYFATVIFCGTMLPHKPEEDQFPAPSSNFNYIHMMENEVFRGSFMYTCTSRAMELKLRNISGYMVMSDDAVYNHWHPLDESRPAHPHGHFNGYNWWHDTMEPEMPKGITAVEAIIKSVNETRKHDLSVQMTWMEYEKRLRDNGLIADNKTAFDFLRQQDGRAVSDWYYIPSSDADFFGNLMDIFFESRFFLELAVGKYLRATDFIAFPDSAYSLTYKRAQWATFYNKSTVMLHPLKLSYFNNKGNSRQIYCETVLQLHVNVTLKLEKYDVARAYKGCTKKFTPVDNSTVCDYPKLNITL